MSAAAPEDEALWAAVANPSRRQLLDALLASGTATPSALAKTLPFTRQATTKHLAVLEEVGLVQSGRVGREVHYSVRADRLHRATRSMTRVAAQWDARLQDIKSIAEARHRESFTA